MSLLGWLRGGARARTNPLPPPGPRSSSVRLVNLLEDHERALSSARAAWAALSLTRLLLQEAQGAGALATCRGLDDLEVALDRLTRHLLGGEPWGPETDALLETLHARPLPPVLPPLLPRTEDFGCDVEDNLLGALQEAARLVRAVGREGQTEEVSSALWGAASNSLFCLEVLNLQRGQGETRGGLCAAEAMVVSVLRACLEES